jgi:DNA-directed RNA polymerase specialized sigma24 family protein
MSGFPTSIWTKLIYGDSPEALNRLCQTYWYPLYAYARSRGHSHEQAEDLTQLFFLELIEKRLVARADRKMTKFRTFLLTHFDYVISNEWRKATAEKRGKGAEHLSIDAEEANGRFQNLAAEGKDPALIYDQAWASQVVDQTLRVLREEYTGHNQDVPFEALQGYLPGGAACPRQPYEELANLYPAVNVGALKTRVSRLNKRFRELLVSVVGETVEDPTEVESEIRYLVDVLAAA